MVTKATPRTASSKWTAAIDRARAADAAAQQELSDAQARREGVRLQVVAAHQEGTELDAEIAAVIRRGDAREIAAAQDAAVEPRRKLAERIAVGTAHGQELEIELIEVGRRRSATGLALSRALQNADRGAVFDLLKEFNGLVDQIHDLWPRVIGAASHYQQRTGDDHFQGEITNRLGPHVRQLASDGLYRPDAQWASLVFDIPDPDEYRD